ncbi:response regulator [filamentous cyanobacterium LEGE 11480]|uniref:Response regulator n=1 Tax=Romeriopsis navalis LEGE 11480 TaxID=2777977 RepID=A0A928VN84_9CYAN|nr:response regulator [Romeriopsis navalis]MBE9031425.1 response regulator [Romeriopsis navalis LEGE 11480]
MLAHQDETQGINLLLVEDDALEVMIVQRALRRSQLNINLQVVPDGVEALEKLAVASENTDIKRSILLLDLDLPHAGGISLLRNLRLFERPWDIPVIVMSHSIDQQVWEATQLDVTGYVPKFLTFAQFAETLGLTIRSVIPT